MGWMRRAKALFAGKKLAKELEDEVQFHLSMREERNVEEGMPVAEARRDARRRFGNVTRWRERMREIDLMTLPETIWQDLKFGARTLMKHPGFTAMAILALALGIGINVTVFTIYKAMVLRQIDAKNASEFVDITLVDKNGGANPYFSYPDYEAYRDGLRAFNGLIATDEATVTLSGAGGAVTQRSSIAGTLIGKLGITIRTALTGGAENVSVVMVSENYFDVLGATAMRGRVFESKDVQTLSNSPSVLISENFWQRRFGGDPSILGRTVKLNGAAFTVIGITGHDFVGAEMEVPDLWMPMQQRLLLHPSKNPLQDREARSCRIFGRLSRGITMGEAQAEMAGMAEHLRSLHAPGSPGSMPGTIHLWPGSPLGREPDSGLQYSVLLIMVTTMMVLVIACANVASLQLARAAARQNELVMRLSLGATRPRLIRQLLTESALLGLLAGGVALLATWGILHVVMAEFVTIVPLEQGSLVMNVTPDMTIFSYVFAISLVAGVLFGLAPALESSKSALGSALKASGTSSPGRSRRLRDVLIAAQVAVCLVLMIAGSLLIRSSMHTLNMATGYEAKQVIDLEVQFPGGGGYDTARRDALTRTLRERIVSLPGVTGLSVGRAPDGGGIRTAAISLNGEKPTAVKPERFAFITYVQPNYFSTLDIPMISGNTFAVQHGEPARDVVVSESQAKELWPGQNPIGRTITMDATGQLYTPGDPIPRGETYQVIGMVRDIRGVLLDYSDSHMIYMPLPEGQLADHPILIRFQGAPALVTGGIGQLASSVDPNMMLYAFVLEDLMRTTPPFVVSRMAAIFTTIIGLLGLFLASMGIYGTVSYVVLLRTREVGIRMALGAKKGDVAWLMLRESTRPVVAGLLTGVVLAVGASYLLRRLLYGMSAVDGVSFVGVSVLFLGIALLAAYVPSRRAMRVDPVVALRYE